MCWTPFSTRVPRTAAVLSAALLVWVAAHAGPRYPRAVGRVEGSATAVYRLAAEGAPAPPSISINGYSQSVEPAPGGWKITVRVDLEALRVRTPFRPGRLPSSLHLTRAASRSLEARLAACGREDQAIEAVLLFLRERLKYVTRPDFQESLQSVIATGQASCVGMTRAAVTILRALGVSCREVVGLKAPPSGASTVLQGGLLHAWLEIDYPGVGRVFCDPFRSTNWVPQSYVTLRVGDGLSARGLTTYTGGTIRLLRQTDRTFYEPPAHMECLLWARPSSTFYSGSFVTGKLLGGLDIPLAGKATLTGAGGSTSMNLWEGNFFFADLSPGVYELAVTSAGGSTHQEKLRLTGMDKRRLIFYSRSAGGEVRSVR